MLADATHELGREQGLSCRGNAWQGKRSLSDRLKVPSKVEGLPAQCGDGALKANAKTTASRMSPKLTA
jgi:hypothetical protein